MKYLGAAVLLLGLAIMPAKAGDLACATLSQLETVLEQGVSEREEVGCSIWHSQAMLRMGYIKSVPYDCSEYLTVNADVSVLWQARVCRVPLVVVEFEERLFYVALGWGDGVDFEMASDLVADSILPFGSPCNSGACEGVKEDNFKPLPRSLPLLAEAN